MSSNQRHQSFAPLIHPDSHTLILGSLPGAESLRQQQYYAHPYNVFWRLVYALFGCEPNPDYAQRCGFILSHGLALWDVCASAERSGSADTSISAVQANDISGLLIAYPNIRRILLNGRKAEYEYQRRFAALPVATVYVPSTSPAFASLTFEDKLRSWQAALALEL
ncbi:MAG: DNA-deoxyinosine glycosylase [Peptococcaceae bacterium]|nr:DNA-deoxyinosine glycosylase [Peptococcaceae bacterium]